MYDLNCLIVGNQFFTAHSVDVKLVWNFRLFLIRDFFIDKYTFFSAYQRGNPLLLLFKLLHRVSKSFVLHVDGFFFTFTQLKFVLL